MTIKEQIEEIQREMDEAEDTLDRLYEKMKSVQNLCHHNSLWEKSIPNELGTPIIVYICSDCGAYEE